MTAETAVPLRPSSGGTSGRRAAVATVCLSGTLEDKLSAAAAAGFDGVEIFEPDFIASPWSAAQVRDRCADLGLSIDLYQPFRDFDSSDPAVLAANLRRAQHKFDVMENLGTDFVLVCSSVAPTALDDDDRIAEQLHQLAGRAAERGLRVCYEALAWGRFVNTYERSWEIVRRAGPVALGLCVDSFHILSRGSDPAGIADIPGEKLFFLQLADAPVMDMDVLQWSRPYPLFPGQGPLDPPALPRAGDVRPPPLPRPRPHGRLPRSTLAGGLQRRLPPVRPGAGGRGRAAVAPGAAGGDGRPALARGAP